MDDLIPNLTKTPNNKVTTWRIFFSRGWYSHFCKVKPGFGEKVREKNPQKPGEGFISKRWLSFNQFEKYAQVKLDHFPKFRGASKKYLSWHHLGIHYFAPLKVIFNNTGTSSQRSVTTKIYTLRKNEEWKNNMFSGAMLVLGRVSRVVTPVK